MNRFNRKGQRWVYSTEFYTLYTVDNLNPLLTTAILIIATGVRKIPNTRIHVLKAPVASSIVFQL
jgi:hypothetical protein